MGMRVTPVLVLVLLAGLPNRVRGARCDATFCRCVPASMLGISEEELVHKKRELADRVASSCDLDLKPGESYVLFAMDREGGLPLTRQCTGTTPEREAATTIAALGAGEAPDR